MQNRKTEQCLEEGRHFLETVANNSNSEMLSVFRASGSKAGNSPSFFLHCKQSADKGSHSPSCPPPCSESINKLQARSLKPPVNITSECVKQC